MLHLISVDLKRRPIKALFIPVCEDQPLHADPVVAALVERARAVAEFKATKDQEITLYQPAGCAAGRVVFRGIGKKEALNAEGLRQMAGKSARRCQKMGFDRMKLAAAERHRRLPAEVRSVCGGALLAREWVSLPSNATPPEALAALIAREAYAAGLSVEVLREKELRRKNMGALLAVAAGSANRPALLVLRHRPDRRPPVALVGKGVTFDSGGINIKTGDGQPDMKGDMAGAAAVAAMLITAARLRMKQPLVGVIPLVENMVSGTSTRPGGIVRTFSGKSVEIGNTDAEGRLILVDALVYAERRFKPEAMVDVATLTGACVIALGEKIAGVFAKDEALQEVLVAAGRRTHKRC
jgi:leucyl aminopeptidase